jgi:hypothetical protein
VPENKNTDKPAYEAPVLTVVGSLHALTMQDKRFGSSDGFTLLGASITNNSP